MMDGSGVSLTLLFDFLVFLSVSSVKSMNRLVCTFKWTRVLKLWTGMLLLFSITFGFKVPLYNQCCLIQVKAKKSFSNHIHTNPVSQKAVFVHLCL